MQLHYLKLGLMGSCNKKRIESAKSLHNHGLVKELAGEYHLTQRGEDTVIFILEEIDKMKITINETIEFNNE